jgi:hypothetical protein
VGQHSVSADKSNDRKAVENNRQKIQVSKTFSYWGFAESFPQFGPDNSSLGADGFLSLQHEAAIATLTANHPIGMCERRTGVTKHDIPTPYGPNVNVSAWCAVTRSSR